MSQFKIPVLLIIFNRPESTRKVLEGISEIQPEKLYVAADGPRENKNSEEQLCNLSRKEVLDNITWKCDVKTLFRSQNMGCKLAVSSAISWFFENEEYGIILEDDCVPHLSFFEFCQVLLKKYKDNEKIMHIGGTNLLGERFIFDESYYFSKMPHIWGWATWRRAWRLYDLKMEELEVLFRDFSGITTNKSLQKTWADIMHRVRSSNVDTWDYQWVYTIWINNGLCISPATNLIKNIGFGPDATHTVAANKKFSNLETKELKITKHPYTIAVNKLADELDMAMSINNERYVTDLFQRLIRVFRKFLKKR